MCVCGGMIACVRVCVCDLAAAGARRSSEKELQGLASIFIPSGGISAR